VDSFRQLHQNPTGWFTYWSQRAGNRAVNRGLRLDYFLISSDLIGNLHASYMSNSTIGVSDHAPVVLQLKL
jgi:exonuclease III